MYVRAKRRWGARTAKAQRLMKVEPPAMVDTAVAQQYQIDYSEHDLEDADVKQVGWRDGLDYVETHVVGGVGVWWRGLEISVSSVWCRIG